MSAIARAVLALAFLLPPLRLVAGGGWLDPPGHGNVAVAWDDKSQDGDVRRDNDGLPYDTPYELRHHYRFGFLSADVGVLPHLEAHVLIAHLWADELVDSLSEDPSQHYHGWSDVWLGLKYQVLAGTMPVAVGVAVRMPDLYQGSSLINNVVVTDVPGLLHHDYAFTVDVSNAFAPDWYASTELGLLLREGAFANAVTFAAEAGTHPHLPVDVWIKLALDGAASIGADGVYTSASRFSPLHLDTPEHAFDYNSSTWIRPLFGVSIAPVSFLTIDAGAAYTLWGMNIDVYREFYIGAGYRF